jgi:hypothetical protein
MELTKSEIKNLSKEIWYHVTTRKSLASLRDGIITNYNFGAPSDFGYGFYLSNELSAAMAYAQGLLSNNAGDEFIIVKYAFRPFELLDNYSLETYPKFDSRFSEFSFKNWTSPQTSFTNADMIYGVLSDGSPYKWLLEYDSGLITADEFKQNIENSSNSRKQICVKNQEIGKEIHFIELLDAKGSVIDE